MLMIRANGLLDLELRHLAALQALAAEGNFGRAARRLGYTQSAVSQQIAALERIVGTKLVERPGGPRPVSLTEAGRLLLGHAEGVMARLQAAQADLVALAEGVAGPLRVGTYQSVGAKVLPTVIRRFTAEWPQVDIELRESDRDEELLEWVERGELDLAFVMLPMPEGPFEVAELMRDPYVLIVPHGSPLARETPSLRQIAGEPLIGYKHCRSADSVSAQFLNRGAEPRYVFRSDDNGTIQGLVAAGVGIALLPRLTVDESDPDVEIVELGDRVPPRLIGIAWHADRLRTAAAEAFVDEARVVCAALAAQPVAA